MELLRSATFLTLIILQSVHGSDAEEEVGDNIQADYFFIVDASIKFSATTFKKQLDFLHTIIHDLDIDQKLSRCCLLTYGEKASTQFGLESFRSQSGVINAVSKATQVEGSGGTEYALRLMLSLFEKHKKPGIPVIAYVFIRETPANIKATMQQAKIVHDKGIIMFGVAIGNEVDDNTLTFLASHPGLLLRVDNITNIERIRIILTKKTRTELKSWMTPRPIISQTTVSQSHVEADYVFLVDASMKILASDFKKQLNFVNDVIRDLAIDQSVSRCALLTYGSSAHTEFEFQSFQSRTEITNAIFKVTQVEGSGGTDRAIRQMLALLEKRDKPDIPVTAVIFIREKSTEVQTTIEEAHKAHNKGVIIFAVAIGNEVDDNMLITVATEKKFIFKVDTYESLTIIRRNITRTTIIAVESWTKPPPIPTTVSTVKVTRMPTTLSTTEVATMPMPTISPTIQPTIQLPNDIRVQTKFDIVFAVDVSKTISDLDLLNQLSFLKLVIRNLGIDQSSTRCGIVTFGSVTRTFLELTTYHEQRKKIMDIVASVTKLEGSGGTDLVLQRVLTMFEGKERVGVPQIGVIFTHRKSTDVKATMALADAAHKKGIILFVVGIGIEVDDREMYAVASRTELVFKVDSYEYLVRISIRLTRKIREVAEQGKLQPQPSTPTNIAKGGETKADFVFVLDVSTTITVTEITTQLNFLQSFIRRIGIDQSNSRCALVTYGSTTMTEFGFTSYHHREEIITAVSTVTRMEGSGGTDLALRRMMVMWKESRQESSRVAYVFMHGKSSNLQTTVEQAQLARKSGIVLFAVGIGSQVEERELRLIASKKEFEFQVKSYVELVRIEIKLTHETKTVVKDFEQSPKSTTDQNIIKGKPADVLFVLGHSATTTHANFTLQLNFVRETVNLLKISKTETHVGVLTFGEVPNLQFGLYSYFTVTEIQSAVTRIVQQTGGSNTDKALKYVREKVFDEKEQRNDARMIVVLITDSKSSDHTFTVTQAALLKNIGVTVLAVGVGTNVDKNELASIASGPSMQHVITVKDYLSLEITVKQIIVSEILHESVAESVCKKTKPADIIFSLPNNIDYQKRKLSLKFLEAMVHRLDNGLGPTHFGLAPCHCDCDSSCGFSLADEWGREEISRFVSNFTKLEQPDEVAKALLSLRQGGFCLHSDADVAKIAIVILDRRSVRLTKAALAEARLLKEKGIRIYPIGVGERPNSHGIDDLTSLASCFDCATGVDTYEHLVEVAEKVASNLANDLCVAFAN